MAYIIVSLAVSDLFHMTCSTEQVDEFMGERENLGRLGVGTVHEHQRREPVNEGEAAELLGVELAVSVGADDAAHHHEHAQLLGMVDEGS